MLGFLIMNASMNGLLTITDTLAKGNLAEEGQSMVLGIQTVETGVFGGIITGIMTALLHNKFHKISLPAYLGFFGGSRFVPIIIAVSSIVLGVVMFFIWPTVQGFILRLLGPFGLHHIFYLPFWQTALGGSLEVKGHMVQGTQNIFLHS